MPSSHLILCRPLLLSPSIFPSIRVFSSESVLCIEANTKSLQSCLTLCNPIDGSPRAPCPWDSPGKNTGVGCHFLLQCMKVKSESEVTQSCPILSDPRLRVQLQLTRLLRPWDFPGKSTEVGCHCIRWPKYWSFSFNISPSNEYSGLISFRMDWLGLLAFQGTLKSLLQHHSSKASILQCSAFFIVQLSDRYMTTGKTIDLTRWTFVGKVMSLLFNMLSRWLRW